MFIYSVNQLLDLFHLSDFKEEDAANASLYDILDTMLDYAVKTNLIEDTVTQKDLLDTKIMN